MESNDKEVVMKKIGMVTLLVFGVFLSLSVARVYAQDADTTKCKSSFEGKKDFIRQKFYEEFNLTDEQKKAWEDNEAKQKTQMEALFGAMKDKKESLHQELSKDKLDMKKINQINGELKKLAEQKIDYELQRILAAQKILTPEQFKEFTVKRYGHMCCSFGNGKGMMKHGMFMHKEYGMMGGMRNLRTSMVATSDGGVIVMRGHKLSKYDKNMNLVKEVKTEKMEAAAEGEDEEVAEVQGDEEGVLQE